jgi:predicted dehydrogenase
MSLTAVVVGAGAGGTLSIQALDRSPLFELIGVSDIRPEVGEKLRSVYPSIDVFTDHNRMFASLKPDVVCVSTYPPSHEQISMDALEQPIRGILVEKPLGHTAASGRHILQAIKARNIPVAVPHGLLAKRTPLEIIERVRNNEIGELKLVEIQCNGWDIINAGIHWINFFVALTANEPVDLVMALCDASTRTYRDGMQVETAAVTYAQTRSGVRVVMNTGDHVNVNRVGKDTLFRIVGTNGLIEFWGWENAYRIVNRQHPDGADEVPNEMPVTGHRFHLEEMARQVQTGICNYRVADSSLAALEICEGAYLSSRERCQVRFPVDGFSLPTQNDWNPGAPYLGVGGGTDGRNL